MKLLFKCGTAVVLLALLLNYSWVHAATVAVLSEPCDEQLLSLSSSSIEALFGSKTSHPIVACVDAPRLGLSVSHGRTSFAPALPPVIIIGPEGRSVDVVAHEIAHAELFQRVGLVRRELSVPTWFDEGLAMQVDHRAAYDLDALQAFRARADLVAPTPEMMDTAEFFTPGDQGKYHYALSKCLVRRWISANPNWHSSLGEIGDAQLRTAFEHADGCN